jgi:predicted house-cleaning NTP pyrophosphatase (Maf/HAM1 superfamily)
LVGDTVVVLGHRCFEQPSNSRSLTEMIAP